MLCGLQQGKSPFILDTEDESYELIPQAENMKPYKIAIFFSGLEHNLASSKFNMRVDVCRSAAYALKAFAGMNYGKFRETHLREVPYEVYLKYKDRLPENRAKRADHWYSEYDRVQRGAQAWGAGDIDTYGRLSFESGYSSIYSYETGSDELKKMYEILLDTAGVYGDRLNRFWNLKLFLNLKSVSPSFLPLRGSPSAH